MTERSLSVEEAASLPPGADHYRAYVGPPGRYDYIGLSQLALLFREGLKDTHKVLDFGCGSLRLGRMLIPFLREGRYFGIEPNLWLVEEGFARELGEDARRIKKPRFSNNAAFDCTVFGERFDFIIAQSIITHAGPDETKRLFASAAQALAPGGAFFLSYINAPNDAPEPAWPAWTYPDCVAYSLAWTRRAAAEAGLTFEHIDWHHPGATWAALRSL